MENLLGPDLKCRSLTDRFVNRLWAFACAICPHRNTYTQIPKRRDGISKSKKNYRPVSQIKIAAAKTECHQAVGVCVTAIICYGCFGQCIGFGGFAKSRGVY